MSASTIARWNAISMTREPAAVPSHKRSRSDDDDDSSDDNISLVSRSPSPQPDRDVEMKDVHTYDEHVRGEAREVITVETKIKSSNKGFAMLAKMGWTEGSPLGVSGDGRVDPIPFTVKQDSTGLGKVTQDFRMIETTVSQRRNLDSERMQFETAEQRQQREASVAQKAAVQSEISSVLRAFYCELCDKQFKTVAQYDEHTNSYAHHHRARTRDMNANHPVRAGGREEAERRKEKERKREEKELRKLAKAAGIKISAPPVAAPAVAGESKGFKKSGWASVGDGLAASSSALAPAPPAAPSASGRCATMTAPAPPAPPTIPAPPPPSSVPTPAPPSVPPNQGFRSGGWSTLSTSPAEALSTSSTGRSGWSSVNSSVAPPPPPPPAPSGPPPPPPPSHSSPRLAPPGAPPPAPAPPSSWSRLPPAPPSHNQPPPPPPAGSGARPPTDSSTSSNPAPPPPLAQTQTSRSPNPNTKPKPKPDEAPAQSRGNWQSFQKMRGRR